MASADERAIRDDVIPVLREICPGSRIIHELNIDHGQCRVDLAAIGTQSLTFVEIKSKKDTLTRLKDQVTVFERACHELIVVLDEKWFKDIYAERLKAAGVKQWGGPAVVWKWPRPPGDGGEYQWRRRSYLRRQGVEPHAMRLLELLWAEELRAECRRHNIACDSRTSRWPMIQRMAWSMTGAEIVKAVCRQLRGRTMAEGDDPCQ